MPQCEKQKIAAQVADHLLCHASEGERDDPRTWEGVAQNLGCRVHPFYVPGGMPGEYAAAGEGLGVITYNTACTPPMQVRVLVHELAHHLLHTWLPTCLGPEHLVCAASVEDPYDVRHQIARMVERQVCPAPGKRMRNGHASFTETKESRSTDS